MIDTPTSTIAAPAPPGRPCISLETAAEWLGRETDDLLQLIDSAALGFCFNVSSPHAQRREIRLLRVGFTAYMEHRPCPVRSLDAAVDIICPKLPTPGGGIIFASDLQRRLYSSQLLIASLITSGELRCQGRATGKESPRILRASVATFLHRRALGVEVAYGTPAGGMK